MGSSYQINAFNQISFRFKLCFDTKGCVLITSMQTINFILTES